MRKLSLFGALAGALFLASAMQAVTISLDVTEAGAPGSLTANSSTGVVSITNTNFNDFVLNNVTGLGTPFYNTPELNLQTLNVTSNSLTSSETLTIEVTETGLTATGTLPVMTAFTGILTGVSSETITAYYDPGNGAYATTDSLGTVTFTNPGSDAKNVFGSITGISGGPFSETEIITATFAAPGTDTLNSSAHISSAVPEPISTGLMGAGLLALGVLKYRRKKK